MLDQMRANLRVNLKFYRRNRLLAGIAILFIILALLYSGAALLFESSTSRFELIRELFNQLTTYAFLFVAAVGLVLISVHVRGKAVKLVFTKPCPPEVWLGAGFVSAVILAFVLHVVILAIAIALSLVWSVPVQSGFALLAAVSLCSSIVAMAYLTFLSTVTHPVLAVIIAIVFSEDIFYAIRTALIAAIRNTGGNILLPLLEKLSYLLYMILPMYNPFAEDLERVGVSMRATGSQWQTLAGSTAYAIVVTILLYLLTAGVLKRKNFV